MANGPKPAGRAAVLDLLKREGPISADALARARHHRHGGAPASAVAGGAGLAGLRPQARPRGRPVKLWRGHRRRGRPFHRFPFRAGRRSHRADAQGVRRRRASIGCSSFAPPSRNGSTRKTVAPARSLKAKLDALAKTPQRRRLHGRSAARGRHRRLAVRREPLPHLCGGPACQGLCREELALFERVLGRCPGRTAVAHPRRRRTLRLPRHARRCIGCEIRIRNCWQCGEHRCQTDVVLSAGWQLARHLTFP